MDLKTDRIQELQLTRTQETMLLTLRAKALDSRAKRSILHDRAADQMVSAIDFDFEQFKSLDNDSVIVVRARQYDEWIREFLAANPDAVVVNLGCGLDTRFTRINPSARVRWFDVDFPDVIALRENFYSNRDGYTMIGSSITEAAWIERIPGDRPAMIVAEGVLEYLAEDEVKALFNRLTGHFEHGQMAFDVMNRFAIRSAQADFKDESGPIHKWAVDDLETVDRMDGRIRRIGQMSLFTSTYMKGLPFRFRLLYGAMALAPRLRNMVRLCRYAFG